MSAIQPSNLPLLNPDVRPLPPGWTQHYDPESERWIYFDMNALPPRVSLTHPSGPPPQTPTRPVAEDDVKRSTGFPARSSVSTPHKRSLQARRDRQNMTAAHWLYAGALPPAGFDEIGVPLNFGADQFPYPAPSNASIDSTTSKPSASPVSTTSTTTSSSPSPVPPNFGRTPTRRPLPKPPISNLTTSTTTQRPSPSRPPDDLAATSIKANENAFSYQRKRHQQDLLHTLADGFPYVIKTHQQDGLDTLADGFSYDAPQTEHSKPSGPPTYALTRKAEPLRYKPSNSVPHRSVPVYPQYPHSLSFTLPAEACAGQSVIIPGKNKTKIGLFSAPSSFHADAELPPSYPSARASVSKFASHGPIDSAVPLAQSTTSPLPPCLTRCTSIPPAPGLKLVRNLRPLPRNTSAFVPPEIADMLSRQMASDFNSAGSDEDKDAFDPMTLYTDASHLASFRASSPDKDAFDPMTLYTDASHSASLHASSPPPQSHEQKSLHKIHQTLSQPTLPWTSMSSSVSPIPSTISAPGLGRIIEHSAHTRLFATNDDPDLVEPSRSNNSAGPDEDTDAFDPMTLYTDASHPASLHASSPDKDTFDPMTLYTDASHSASLHASSPPPQSHEQKSLHKIHQMLSQSTLSLTSISSISSVSLTSSIISASGLGALIEHSHTQLLATNYDPDLVETSRSNQDKATEEGRNKLKKLHRRPGLLSPPDEGEPGGPLNCTPVATCQVACFGATDALEHIRAHRDNIIMSLGVPQSEVFVLAGFDGDYIREGVGLLQEIHILLGTDVTLAKSTLAEVGNACSPFSSAIFMPSGTRLRPPLYDRNLKPVPSYTLAESVCKLRYSLAANKGLSLAGRTVNHNGRSSHHTTTGNRPASDKGSSTSSHSGSSNEIPDTSGESAGSSQVTSGEESAGRTPPAQNSGSDKDKQNLPQGRKDALPPNYPDPDDDCSTKHLRRVRLALSAGVRHALYGGGPMQQMQLRADFGFQLEPAKSATVQFTKLSCSDTLSNSKERQNQYSHQYLKVLVDAQSPKWISSHCTPTRTPAAQREAKHISTDKRSWQGAFKIKAGLAPSGNLEGSYTSDKSKATETVRFTSGIMQKEWLGECTWGFTVDDENEQLQGLQLSGDRLPDVSLDYLPDARQTSESDIPQELTVEISSFWSLVTQGPFSWLSIAKLISQGQRPLEYSNFVHSVRVDLPADMDCDGHYVAKQDVVIGGGIPERREIVTESQGMLVNSGIQLTGKRHPEDVTRWLPKLKVKPE